LTIFDLQSIFLIVSNPAAAGRFTAAPADPAALVDPVAMQAVAGLAAYITLRIDHSAGLERAAAGGLVVGGAVGLVVLLDDYRPHCGTRTTVGSTI
jgi:hypothetical protein